MKKMNIRLIAMLLLLATLAGVFAGCGAKEKDSVLLAFKGDSSFESDEVKQAIERYREKCVPYEVTKETAVISFPVKHQCLDTTVLLVSCVDDSTPDLELISYTSQDVPASANGEEVEVDVSWWYDADSKSKATKTWSYLVRTMDDKGNFNFYYFRVNYQNG